MNLLVLLASLVSVIGCAVNPVTGHRELSLLSTADEIAMGENQYGPLQQVNGGLYNVDPAVARYVTAVGNRVAQYSDRNLPYEFVVLNESTPNAWALPGGKIGIHRGLLVELENGAELAAILGHEIVHAAAKHTANDLQRDLVLGLVGLGVELAADDSKHAREITAASRFGIHLAGQKFSRDDERDADYHGMKYMYRAGYDTEAAVSVQEKFVALAEGRNANWLEGLFATHPPTRERVSNNRTSLLEFPPGGDLGKASFEVHMQTLFEDATAYDLADQARGYADNDPSHALQLIDRALSQQPDESMFHGIQGDIFATHGRYRDAVDSYAAAIDQHPGYFGHFYGRGLSFDAMGYTNRARDDLRRSNRLLRIPYVSYKLGTYALTAGDRAEAKREFEFASQGSGELAETALNTYVRLDVEDVPWEYIDSEPYLDNGQIVVEVENSSGYPISDIVVHVRAEINGEEVARRLNLERLDSGYYDILDTAIYYLSEDRVRVRTEIQSATPGW